MQCPRLDHFVRFNTNGSVTCCGHMVKAQGFNDIDQMHNSEWIESLKDKFFTDQWRLEFPVVFVWLVRGQPRPFR